jgi:hypothetical protein
MCIGETHLSIVTWAVEMFWLLSVYLTVCSIMNWGSTFAIWYLGAICRPYPCTKLLRVNWFSVRLLEQYVCFFAYTGHTYSHQVIWAELGFEHMSVVLTSHHLTWTSWILISSAMFSTISLTGLAPSTQYFYVCGDPSLGEMSKEYSFTTLPLPSPASYPSRVAIVGDIGLTDNSSATLDHIKLNDPSLLLVIGDLSYANNYLTTGESAACYSCSFPTAPTRETYQPHWDNWGR